MNPDTSLDLNLHRALPLLERTPAVLDTLLRSLPDEWVRANEGPDTFSPFDVVGHLIHGEKTDWITRMRHILAGHSQVPFTPYDRFAQWKESEGKTMDQLLDEFSHLRSESLRDLKSVQLGDAELALPGLHGVLGPVNLRQLLSTWVVHDLSHLAQISRVLAKQLGNAVGPWSTFLPILGRAVKS